MYIPDGFLNDGTAASLFGVATMAVVVSFRKVRATFLEKVPVLKMRFATFPASDGDGISFESRLSRFGRERVWRMAAAGALVFSAQMINFPIGGGISGHILGGVLALGANIFNMGVVGGLGGYGFFRFLLNGRTSKRLFLRNVFVAAWVSVVFAAVATSFEIALSGTKALSVVLPAMILIHIAIGFFEGIFTAGILSILLKKNFKLAVFEKETYGA